MLIPLFDIDGTLLHSQGVSIHRQIMHIAWQEAYGIDASMDEIFVPGMIDSEVLLAVAQRHGISEQDALAHLPKAFEVMDSYTKQHGNEAKYTALPGAKDILEAVHDTGFLVGILTGNVESSAYMKLRAADLESYIDFGSFGNEATQRTDLVVVARKKAENLLHIPLTNQHLVLIGDTPRDILCAQQNNTRFIGVASGPYSKEELLTAGASVVIDSLEEQEKMLQFLQEE